MDQLIIQYGKLSPMLVECEDGKPTLEDFKIDPKQFNTLIKKLTIYGNSVFCYFKFSKEDIALLKYYDQLLDIPIIEALMCPSYKTFKRLIDNDIDPPNKLLTKNVLLDYMRIAHHNNHNNVIEYLKNFISNGDLYKHTENVFVKCMTNIRNIKLIDIVSTIMVLTEVYVLFFIKNI